MDVYLPPGRSSATPVVVLIHGGGWTSGDKAAFTVSDIRKFTDAGYAVANMNYRVASVSPPVHDPALSDDVTAVLDYITAHAAEYGVSGSQFAIGGISAGAHLALLAAYKYNASGRIKAVASLSGPTDFTDSLFLATPTIRTLLETYLGTTQSAAPGQWIAASPVFAATSNAPPTIIMQGAVDALVPRTQGDRLDARLQALGVAHEYHLFPTYNHDLGFAALLHFPDAVLDPVVAWFSRAFTH